MQTGWNSPLSWDPAGDRQLLKDSMGDRPEDG